MEKSDCDLCGDQLSKPFIKYDYKAFPCFVSICMKCGLVKLNPRWEESKYRHFYQKKYDLFYRGPSVSIEELFEIDFTSKGQKTKARLQNIPLPQKIKMLDIGAGTGSSFFSMPEGIQVESYAIEAAKKCVTFLLSKGVSVIGNDFSDDFGGGYDLIIARHVLEHSMDPINFLTKICNSLKREGLLYIVVPNAMYLNKKKASSFFRHPHTYYFNICTLMKMCRKAGLYALKTGEEGEIWAVLTPSKTDYVIPDISPADQLNMVREYIGYHRFSIKSLALSVWKRLYYRAF